MFPAQGFLSLEFPRTAQLLVCESKIPLLFREWHRAVSGMLAKCVSVTCGLILANANEVGATFI